MVESSSQFRTFACYEVIRFFIISPNSPIEKLKWFYGGNKGPRPNPVKNLATSP